MLKSMKSHFPKNPNEYFENINIYDHNRPVLDVKLLVELRESTLVPHHIGHLGNHTVGFVNIHRPP